MKETTRLPELDALRGLAVLLMVLYHTAFDLDYFWGWPVLRSLGVGEWVLARTSAILFLLVAGICFTLSWERNSPSQRLQKIVKRFLVLALSAALVSGATWLIAPQDFVKFGILHLFALSTLLLPLLAPLKLWNTLIGSLVITLSYYSLPTTHSTGSGSSTNYLLRILLGSPPPSFSSLDYFPLIPWFGVLLLGTSIGHLLYIQHSHWRIPNIILHSKFLILHSVGRHSLMIYLLHQPVLLAILSLVLGKPPNP